MKTFMTAHMCDLEREGLESALARLSGQVGVDAICVSALSAPMVRAHVGASGAVGSFECEGGACFQADATLYAGTRLRPHIQDWIRQRNPLDALVRAAEKHRMGLRLRMEGCYQPAVAKRNHLVACVNILGVTSATWLCPSQAGVREYLISIAGDLCKNYAPAVLELAHAGFPDEADPAFPEVMAGADLSCAVELLNWCFCSACRERMGTAGLDAQSVVGRAQDLLRNLLELEEGAEAAMSEWLLHDSVCKSIRAFQSQTVASLVSSIRERVTGEVCLVRPAKKSQQTTADSMLDCVVTSLSESGGSERSASVYRAYPPYAADGPALVAAIHATALAGADTIGFSDYGLLSAKSLDWVRQAIRYAKRQIVR